MVSLVIVSHSKKLSEGVKELASQMSQNKIAIEAVGGISGSKNSIGTDPTAIQEAIEKVYSQDGVLVLMDLGSAIMSTEIARENLPIAKQHNVILCEAALVEGAISAAAQAGAGASIIEVANEARRALRSKSNLIHPESKNEVSAPQLKKEATSLLEIIVPNKLGIHARPAAKLVEIANRLETQILVGKENQSLVSAKSISQVSTLGAKKGDKLIFAFEGKDIVSAKEAIHELVEQNFGDPKDDLLVSEERLSNPNLNTPKIRFDSSIIKATPGSEGIAIGPIICHERRLPSVDKTKISNYKKEIQLFEIAIQNTIKEFGSIQKRVSSKVQKSASQIFDFHLLLLRDDEFINKIKAEIEKEGFNWPHVWSRNVVELEKKYLSMDSAYMAERAADISDVGKRVLGQLTKGTSNAIVLSHPGILVADEIGPSEIANLNTDYIQGIITAKGGTTSHATILAKSLNIPSIIGIGEAISYLNNNEEVAIDGAKGWIWLSHGNEEKVARLKQQKKALESEKISILKKAQSPAITKDGIRYDVLANVSGAKDAALAYAHGADGVGLYRTEFLYMNRDSAPSEEEQYKAYKAVCEAMHGLPVTIRTLDVGGDKPLTYLGIGKEKNPYLGLRAIRYCLQNVDLFKQQLRAICRLSADYPIRLMYPMIGVPEEVIAANKILKEVQLELDEAGIPFSKHMEVGIMIEVPSTIFCIPALANICDFFSIGTNDLTQYLLALDRGNESVAKYRTPFHPAVLRALQEVIRQSKQSNIEIGMCGEFAGDPKATELLIKMGLDEFSLSGSGIPRIKENIRTINKSDHNNSLESITRLSTLKKVEEEIVGIV